MGTASVVVKNPCVKKQNVLILVDCVIITGIIVCAHLAATRFNVPGFPAYMRGEIAEIIIALFLQVLALYIFDLYNVKSFLFMSGRLVRVTFAVLSALALTAIIFYMGRFRPHLTVCTIQTLLLVPFLYFWRELFFHHIVKNRKQSRVLLVGNDPLNDLIYKEIVLDPITDYHVVNRVGDVREAGGRRGHPSLCGIVIDECIDIVVFSLQVIEEYSEDLLALKARGMETFDSLTFYKLITGRVPIMNLKDSVISCLSGKMPMSSYYRNLKRLVDIVLSLFGIIVSGPFIALAALLVWLESPGPILFKPERLGENGKTLKLLKLRTMYHRREENQGPLFTQTNDARITKVGAILRKTGLDEFPQLFNVLLGHMSLVGPRPIEEVYVEKYIKETPLYYLRISMKPGISGWAQVMQVGYPNTDGAQMVKLQYDLFYISHASLFLDGIIILKTLKKFLNFGSHDSRDRNKVKVAALESLDEHLKEFVLN